MTSQLHDVIGKPRGYGQTIRFSDSKCVQFSCVMGMLAILIMMWVIVLMNEMSCFVVKFHLNCYP